MVSPVMAGMAWRMMFGVKYGAINNLGRQFGLLDVYFDWFSSPFMSIVSVVLVEVWQSFWHLTLPLLKFTMVVGVMIRMIDLTKLFGLIFVLTFGGPSTRTLSY